MKTLLIALALFTSTAQAADSTCNNQVAKVIVRTEFAQKLIDYVMAIDSIPLGGMILSQTDESATLDIRVFDDRGEGGFDAFDIARVIKGIRETEKDGMGILQIIADVCFRVKDPGGTGDSGNVGTIGHD